MTVERCGTGVLPGTAVGRCGAVLHLLRRGGFSSSGSNRPQQNLAERFPLPLRGLASPNALFGRSGGRFGAFSCFPQQAGEAQRLHRRGARNAGWAFYRAAPAAASPTHGAAWPPGAVLIPLHEPSFRGPKLRVTDSIFPSSAFNQTSAILGRCDCAPNF